VLIAALATGCSSSGSDAGAAGSDGSSSASSSTTVPTPSKTDPPPVSSTDEQEALVKARPVKVIVPAGYEAGTPAPLVVLLHGFGTTGDIQSAYLGMDAASDRAGMLLVHPDGTKNVIDKQFWNATDACCAGPRAPSRKCRCAVALPRLRSGPI